MNKEHREIIKHAVEDEGAFVRLTLSGKISQALPLRRVVVRPVEMKRARYLQFSYFDAKQDTTKNYRGEEALEKLDELLALPFGSLRLQASTEDIAVQVMKNGKTRLTRKAAAVMQHTPNLAHDRGKDVILPAHQPDAFLQTLGIMNKQGGIVPGMQDKFRQINEFLKLLEHTGVVEGLEKRPVQMLDCGSGSAHLSFAAYHYLNTVRGIAAELMGIDSNGKLVEKSSMQSRELGFSGACFQQAAIADYVPEVAPAIVLALHACDTATDDAIFQGIRADARLILCAPCCHHYLHEQLKAVAPFEPVFQQGILKKRMADILTDTLRALALRICGYKTDVVEFVATEHTDRNLMIRAVKRTRWGDKKALREYEELKQFWGVTPYIEKVLRERGLWVGEV